MYTTHCLLPGATSGCNLRTSVGAGCSGRVLSDHAFFARRATASRTPATQNKLTETSCSLTAASQDGQPPGSLRVSISKDRSSQRCLAKRRGKSAVDVGESEPKLQQPVSGNLLGHERLCLTVAPGSMQVQEALKPVQQQVDVMQSKQAAQQVQRACNALSLQQQHPQLLSPSQLCIAAAHDLLMRSCCKSGRRCVCITS